MEYLKTHWFSSKLKEAIPEWRRVDKTISSMISEITEWRQEYDKIIKESHQAFLEEFSQTMKSRYIEIDSSSERDQTIMPLRKGNTGKAIDMLKEIHREMDHSGLLTPQTVNGIHRILLSGLHEECGKLRTKGTYAEWKGEKHCYPSPEHLSDSLFGLLDRYNNEIERILKNNSEIKTEHIFMCAAELMVRFTSIHPYGDGNGRMCRLLANYVVGLITPFPVSLYNNTDENRSKEDDYINAIVRWRNDSTKGPYELAAMLVEGAWHGWKQLFSSLEK